MEDNLSGRLPQWKTTSLEDYLKEIQPQWKMTSMKKDNLNLNARKPEWKTTSICLACQFCTELGPAQPQLVFHFRHQAFIPYHIYLSTEVNMYIRACHQSKVIAKNTDPMFFCCVFIYITRIEKEKKEFCNVVL